MVFFVEAYTTDNALKKIKERRLCKVQYNWNKSI